MKITDIDRLEAIAKFLSNPKIGEFPQSEIRSAIWHIMDTKETSVVTGLLGGVEDAIRKGYKL